MSETNPNPNCKEEKLGPASEKAIKLCKEKKAEKDLRDAIADIASKLNRSHLSAEDGIRYADYLSNAYATLLDLEKELYPSRSSEKTPKAGENATTAATRQGDPPVPPATH
jgi:hypothetical protein